MDYEVILRSNKGQSAPIWEDKMKIVTKEMVEQRIRDRWPDEPFEIIEYTRVSKPFKIKCLDCGLVRSYSSFNGFIGNKKDHWCLCRQNSGQAKHYQNQQKILKMIEESSNKSFIKFYFDEKNQKYRVQVRCEQCQQIIDKSYQSYLLHPDCTYCENRQLLNTQAINILLPDGFELLEDYVDESTKVLIRHNCGFIWKTYPRHIIGGRNGCPKCNRKRSKGEQRIAKWLELNNLDYEIEKTFSWQTKTRTRYDFYVPQLKLIIEYMGRQHYEEVKGWLKDTLAERQERDRIKKQDAIDNNFNFLEISYVDFENIETILTDWFNDYSERK